MIGVPRDFRGILLVSLFFHGLLTNRANRAILFCVKSNICLLISLVVILLAGCASMEMGPTESNYYKGEAARDEYRALPAPAPATAAKQEAPASAPAMPLEVMGSEAVAAPPAASPEKPQERLRVYSGFGRLIVEDVDETKDKISRLAEDNGGYIEGVWENLIIIRVPKELFHALFQDILSFGEVDFKKIETVDVTEYVTDLTSRKEIAERTRERLYTLLEKTEDVEERLKILREIRRLTEEIEKIQNTLRSMETYITFSRIQMELQPRLSEDAGTGSGIPFPWIADLDPLYPALDALEVKPEVPLDETFAVFSQDKIFRAEDARGVRVRISRTKNTPKGDTEFWQEALIYHLSPFYAKARRVGFQEGALKGLLLASKDTDPFYYLLAQRVQGEYIVVFEAFFPDSEELEKTREAVFTAFEGTVLP